MNSYPSMSLTSGSAGRRFPFCSCRSPHLAQAHSCLGTPSVAFRIEPLVRRALEHSRDLPAGARETGFVYHPREAFCPGCNWHDFTERSSNARSPRRALRRRKIYSGELAPTICSRCRGGERQAARYALVGLDRSRREWVALHAPAPRSSRSRPPAVTGSANVVITAP